MTSPKANTPSIFPPLRPRTMKPFIIDTQPDDQTCGPTCLHAVYRYYGENISLHQVIKEVTMLEDGGTLAVWLACDALRRGYSASIYTYNLQIFDPTWFSPPLPDLAIKLRDQAQKKTSVRLKKSTEAYLEFLALGGTIHFRDLTPRLLTYYLHRDIPVLTGLCATYLYGCARERSTDKLTSVFDDVRGTPQGHFVVLTGYDPESRLVQISDPYSHNPLGGKNYYAINVRQLINAIMLGILTYDANLLILQPKPAAPDILITPKPEKRIS